MLLRRYRHLYTHLWAQACTLELNYAPAAQKLDIGITCVVDFAGHGVGFTGRGQTGSKGNWLRTAQALSLNPEVQLQAAGKV